MYETVERLCPHCQRKLRSDNTKGICAKCQARGRTLDGVYGLEKSAPPKKHEVLEASPDDVMTRFTQVATGLGKDPHAILAEAAQGWLDSVAELINAADKE